MTAHRKVADSKTPRQERPRSLGAAVFVWGTFLVCLAIGFLFVREQTVNVPFADDWVLLPVTTGQTPLDVRWLWAQHNEHRIPLPRLILFAASWMTQHDFRAGCWITLGMFAILAALLLLLARHLRGYTIWTDAFFPLTILHLGHADNLTWSFQIQFAGSVLLPLSFLTLMIWRPTGPSRLGEVLLGGCCGIALCGFGASSIVYAPFAAAWLAYAAWNRRTEGTPATRRISVLLLASALLITVTIGLYFWGLERLEQRPPTSAASVARTAAQFFAMGLSPSVTLAPWPLVSGIVPILIAATGFLLLWIFRTQPAERHRSAGLLLFLAGVCTLAAGIGWGRAAQGPSAGFMLRYTTLAMPAICLVFLAMVLYVPRPWSSIGQGILDVPDRSRFHAEIANPCGVSGELS